MFICFDLDQVIFVALPFSQAQKTNLPKIFNAKKKKNVILIHQNGFDAISIEIKRKKKTMNFTLNRRVFIVSLPELSAIKFPGTNQNYQIESFFQTIKIN